MVKFLAGLGAFAGRRPWLVLGGWVLMAGLLVGLGRVAGGTFVDDFGVPGADSQRATELAQAHFGAGNVSAEIVFHVGDGGGTLRDADRARAIQRMVEAVQGQPSVASVPNPIDTATVSADGRTALTTVQYTGPANEIGVAALQRLDEAAAPARQAGLTVEFRGWLVEAASRPQTGLAELIGLAAAALVLLIAFGSLLAAVLPIVSAVVGLGTGSALVLVVASGVSIPSAAPIVAVMLGLGAGIDYALFLLTRFRQNVGDGMAVPDALRQASGTAGAAIVFAGGTVVVAILGLAFAGIPFVSAMGLASALIVSVMVIAALTLVPAMLGIVGKRVLARRRAGSASRWVGWGQHVRKHRWPYAIGSTLILLVLSTPLLSLRLGMPDDRVQPPSATQRRAYDLVAQGFGPGYNGPLLVVVQTPARDSDVLERLSAAIRRDPAVAAVAMPRRSEDGMAGLLTVIPRGGPQDASTSELVHRLRTEVRQALAGTQTQAYVGGRTALMIDMADRVGARLPYVIGGVLVVAFLLLVVVFRSILVPVKATVLTLLSIGAAYGVVVAVFQWGWGLRLLGSDQPVPIMSVVPMFLFSILFGLSMDYEVFLMSRIREDYVATGASYQAVISGLAATGRVITSAAAIMAVVFLSFVGIANPLVKMVGIGLSVAVLVDATLIRLVLVPALMSLLGAGAWWFPGRAPKRPPHRHDAGVEPAAGAVAAQEASRRSASVEGEPGSAA